MRLTERRRRLLTPVRATALAALAALLALAGTASAASLRPPNGKVISGASTEFPPRETVPAFTQLTQQPGLGVVNVFSTAQGDMEETLKPLQWIDSAAMVSWRLLGGNVNSPGGSLESVATGGADTYLASSARAIQTFPRPVYVRLMWEMNGDWFNWSYAFHKTAEARAKNTPDFYKQAWQRVRIIVDGGSAATINNKLTALGLPAYAGPEVNWNNTAKTSWVWSVAKGAIRSPVAGETTESYYPGDDYVDWIGTSFHQTSCNKFDFWAGDGNPAIDTSGDPLASLNNLYAFAAGQRPFLAPLPGLDEKPLMLTEWAVSTKPFGCDDNPQWINDTAAWFKSPSHPLAEGHLYFNRVKDEGSGGKDNDHLLSTHTGTAAAYRTYVDGAEQLFDWTDLQGVAKDNSAPVLQKTEHATTSSGVYEVVSGNPELLSAETRRFRFTFNEAVDPNTMTGAFAKIVEVGTGAALPTELTFDYGLKVFKVDPVDAGGTVTELPGGSYQIRLEGVKNVHGVTMPTQTVAFTVKDAVVPRVSTTSPAANATGVAVTSPIVINFSEPVTGATNEGASKLKTPAGSFVTVTRTMTNGNRTLTLTPSAPLANSTTYTVDLFGGAGAIEDPAGNNLTKTSFSFTTADPAPAPGGGGTGPGTTGGGTTGGTTTTPTGGATPPPSGRTANTDPCTGLRGVSLATCQARKTYTAAAARCAKSKGAAKAACIARAKAQQTFAVANAKCTSKKGKARTRCIAVAKAKRTVALKSAGCLLKTGKAKARCQVSVTLLRKRVATR